MIQNPAVEVTYQGLTHTCMDPGCHIPGFIKTLQEITCTCPDPPQFVAFDCDLHADPPHPQVEFQPTRSHLRIVKEDS